MSVVVRGLSECERNLRNGATQAKVASQRAMYAAGQRVLYVLKQQMSGTQKMDPFWGRMGAEGDFMGARTGGTRNRMTAGRVMTAGDTAWVAVGSPDKYVKNAEGGGGYSTSNFFRIPTAAAQTGVGVDRLMGRSFRSVEGGFLFKSKAGNLWGAVRKGRGAMTLMYLFVKSITIRGRHVFARTRDTAAPQVVNIATLEVQSVVRAGNGG